MRSHWISVAIAGTAVVAVAGCSGAPSGGPSAISGAATPAFSIDKQAFYESLANPTRFDWSKSRLTTPEVDRMRSAEPAAARERQLLALGSNWSASTAAFGASGKITSAPAYDFMFMRVYWITENGWLLWRSMVDSSTGAFRVSTTDTFPQTAVTLSFDGKRVYLCSVQGRFFAVNAFSGAQITGSPVAMGGTNGNVTVAAPPFIDALASRPDGQNETVYAVSQTGTLYRFAVTAPKNTGTQTLVTAQTYALPVNNAAPYTELFRASPVVIRGKAVLGSWRRHGTDNSLHLGNIHYYDTGCASFTTGTTTGANIRTVGVSSPVWASPAIEFNDALEPVYTFVPTGYVATMVDLLTGDQAQSPGLIVNQTTPTSGSLFGYPYGTSGVSTKTLTPVANGTLSISDDNTTVFANGTTKDTTNIVASARYDGSVTTPFWAYLKFYVAKADTIVGGSERSIIDAKFELRCNSSSNANGSSNIDPLRGFRVSNYLSDGVTPWDAANMTPTTRPGFEDGAAFALNNLNSHGAVELAPNAGNSFKNGQRYTWSAKGRIAASDVYYSFGMAHPEAPYINTAPNNGQPFKESAPRFDGGADPTLILTLSGEGFSTPTMENPIAIDSANKRIFVVNTNALYSVTYHSPTYDGSANPYDPLSFGERKSRFNDPQRTFFALTRLGRDTDSPGNAGPLSLVPSKQYVSNVTAPLFMGNKIFVQDNHPGYNRTSINCFLPGTPSSATATGAAPVLDPANPPLLLANGSGDADKGGTYLVYDRGGGKLFAGTFDTGSNAGRTWVLNQ